MLKKILPCKDNIYLFKTNNLRYYFIGCTRLSLLGFANILYANELNIKFNLYVRPARVFTEPGMCIF